MVTEALRDDSPSRVQRGRGSVKHALTPQGPTFSLAQRILMAAQGRSTRESIRASMFIQQAASARSSDAPEVINPEPAVVSAPIAITLTSPGAAESTSS